MNLFRILGPPGDFIKNPDFLGPPFCMGHSHFVWGHENPKIAKNQEK
jgi:hypothetical protein